WLTDLMDARDHAARITSDVEFAELVLADRGDIVGCDRKERGSGECRTGLRECPHAAANKVTKNIEASESRSFRPAVNVAADDCVVALAVIVVKDGQSEARHRAIGRGLKTVTAFHDVPSKICPALGWREPVNFLKAALANITDPQITRDRVE